MSFIEYIGIMSDSNNHKDMMRLIVKLSVVSVTVTDNISHIHIPTGRVKTSIMQEGKQGRASKHHLKVD